MIEVSKWIEMAQVCDHWRARYHEMSFEDQKTFYNNIFKEFPVQRRFNYPWFVQQFEDLKDKSICVIEFGGYDGELARNIMVAYGNVEKWFNYDFYNGDEVPIDEYYAQYKSEYIWDSFSPGHMVVCGLTHVFVSAHTIEHISNEHFDLLYNNVISKCDYALLEIPLPFDVMPDWKGYAGTHILKATWKHILDKFTRDKWNILEYMTHCGAFKK